MTEYKLVPIEPFRWMAIFPDGSGEIFQEYGEAQRYANNACFDCDVIPLYKHPPQQPIDVEKLKREEIRWYASGESCQIDDYDKGRVDGITQAIDHLAAHYNITKKGE